MALAPRRSRRRGLVTIALLLLILGSWAGLASAQPFAYITNVGDGTVSVIDTTTNTVVGGPILVGGQPSGVAVNPARTRAYVANFLDFPGTVSVIDTATNSVLTTIPVGNFPFGVAVSPLGDRVYVGNSGDDTVSVIDVATNTVSGTITDVLDPQGLVVSPDGTRVYAANCDFQTVTVINATTNLVITTIDVGSFAQALAITPDGTRLYVTNPDDDRVLVIDTATNTVIPGATITLPVGSFPYAPAVTPDGTRLYVTNSGTNNVAVIDAATNTIVGSPISVGSFPGGLAFNPTGTRLYVANSNDNTVSVIDISTDPPTPLAPVPVGSFPLALGDFIGAYANAMWRANPATNDFNTGTNWTPATVPIDTGTFAASTITSLTFSASASLNTLRFNAGAPAYTFNLSTQFLTLAGLGIANNSSNAPTFEGPGVIEFDNSASAGNAIFNNTPGAIIFANSSTASTATITSAAGGVLSFTDTSNAGSALINTFAAALTQFTTNSTGGTAILSTVASGIVDFSGTTGPAGDGKFTAGSIVGGGEYRLGAGELSVGSNGFSTTVSGTIQDGGSFGGPGASLVKVGGGTLTLTGANTYTGPTTVNAGKLVVNSPGSIVSPVTVNAGGVLGGTGTLGAVTVLGGTLSPGASPGIINTGILSLNGASTLTIEINGPNVGTEYDQVNVTGTVTLGGATLSLLLGFVPIPGQVFTIINNDLADLVTGTFAGLPEGSVLTVSGRRFRVSYVGGTGNDVTLTALPGPPTIGAAFGAASIAVGSTTTLSFTITNPNGAAALSGLAFSDTLPAGLVIATPNGLSNTCGGTVTALAGSSSITLTGGVLAGGASCSVTISVTVTSVGTVITMTTAVTSTEGGSGGTASASLGVFPGPGPGRSILFPYITTETGKFTFVTIANDGAGGFGGPTSPPGSQLLFSYGTKPSPIVNKAACEHFDGVVGTTDADLMSFEVGHKVTGLGGATVLFEPGVGAPVTSTPLALPNSNRVGFLIVEPTSAGTNAALFGTAAVVDGATGLAWSYSTNFSSSSIVPNPSFSAIDGGKYSGGAPVGPGGVGLSGFKNATWYPTSVVTTSWYVLPLGNRATMAPVGGGGIRLGLRTATDHLPAPNLQGAYDLDERFFSGGNQPLVRCLGLLTRSDVVPSATALATSGGGFTFIAGNGDPVTAPVTDPVDSGGVYAASPFSLFKLETMSTLGAAQARMHREPDHDPCFNPAGIVPGAGSCAGY